MSDELTPLQLAQQRRREMREQGIEVERLDPIQKLAKNPTNRRLAINAHCWGCMGGGADANTRGSIRDCTITGCALWYVRPYQSKTTTDEETDDVT